MSENIIVKGKRTNLYLQSFEEIKTLRDVIDFRVKTHPETPFYTYTDYDHDAKHYDRMPEEVKEHVEALGSCFNKKYGTRAHIALMGDNTYELMNVFWSVGCSNNISVHLDKGLEVETLEKMLKLSDATVLFYDHKYEEKAKTIEKDLGIEIHSLEEIPDLREEGKKLIEEGYDEYFKQTLDPGAAYFFMFTSGTTGTSKCVMLSQTNFIDNSIAITNHLGVTEGAMMVLPQHHVLGLNCTQIPHLIAGCTVYLISNPRYMFRDMAIDNPTLMVTVPLFVELCYKMIWKNIKEKGIEEEVKKQLAANKANPDLTPKEKREMFKEALSILGTNFFEFDVGAAVLEDKYYYGLKDFGIEIVYGYGITECSPIISSDTLKYTKPDGVGLIMDSLEVMIENPNERGEGEICVKGTSVMLGYYKNEEATKEAMRGGWFHTGDIGFFDEDEFLHISGRIKNLIILPNGENVSPEELENVLMNQPAINEVVVYEKNNNIAAQIYIDPEQLPDGNVEKAKEDIQKYVDDANTRLAAFKNIQIVEFRDKPFARTSSMKIIRSSVE